MVKAVGTDGDNGNDGTDGKDGKDGVTPKMKIENGMWYVSCDGGVSWELLGKATGADGDSFFKDVWQDSENAYFKMADDTVISIPLASAQKFNIILESSELPVMNPGTTKSIKYSIVKYTDRTIVKTVTQNGWVAVVNPGSAGSGEILVQAPSPIVQSEILVFASNGNGETAMAVLDCVEGKFTVAKSSYEVGHNGGNIDLLATTNMDFTISIPTDAQSWISEVATKSVSVKRRTLAITPNTGYVKRYSTVKLIDGESNVLADIVILQNAAPFTGALSVSVASPGQLRNNLSAYDYATIKSISISGPLNESDYTFLKDELVSLKRIDLSGATGVEPDFRGHQHTIDLLILPSTLSSISDSAFAGSYVVSVVLPDGLTSIGDRAFHNCSKMTCSIVIPQSVSYLGSNAFNGTAVESLTFEKGVKLLKFTADCLPSRLKSLTIPASIMAIQTTDFGNLTALENLSFEEGSNITEIPSLCFAALPLKNVVLPKSLRFIRSSFRRGVTTKFRGKDCYGGAFEYCSSLQSIHIPGKVSAIEPAAFRYSGLRSVSFAPEISLKTLSSDLFTYSSLESVKIPASVEEIQYGAFAFCNNLRNVTFEEGCGLKTIGGISTENHCLYGAFYSCGSLQQIEIPSSVECIGGGAFSRCSSLVSLSFESGSVLKEIGGIRYSSTTTYTYYGAFSDCTNLRKVLIPMSVTKIYGAAFSGCVSLYDVSFEENSKCSNIEGETFLEEGPFSNTAVESLTLPKSMSLISSCGLYGMSRLASVTFEGTGTVCIKKDAFKKCLRLTQIDASKGGIEVDREAFYSAIKLVKIGAVRPPSCDPSGFKNVSYATLMVPEDSIEEYSTAPGWKEFDTITKL